MRELSEKVRLKYQDKIGKKLYYKISDQTI